MAMVAGYPVHQATDSRAYQSRANSILLGQNVTRKKPWPLVSDGDLWEVFESVSRKRGGATTTRISWCKGHAGDLDIQRGTSEHFLK